MTTDVMVTIKRALRRYVRDATYRSALARLAEESPRPVTAICQRMLADDGWAGVARLIERDLGAYLREEERS